MTLLSNLYNTISGTTASNLGSGEGIYSTKVGVDLQFKSLIGGDNITLSSDSNEITISGSAGGGGTSGTSGSSGTSGADGTSGSSGTSGEAGTSGSSGTSGADGTSGSSGTSGVQGDAGTSGSSGTSGIDGTSGSSGTSGVQGDAGTSGSSGTSGIDGTSGTSGAAGTSGSSGSSGTSGVGGISNIVEDTTPQLGGDLDTNDYSISFDPTPGSNLEANGLITTMTVDINSVGIGSAFYMASDENFEEANANSSSTMPCTALALETGTGSKKVLLLGFMRKDAWNWTPGNLLYVSTTSGTLTQTTVSGSGDNVQVVGYATHADRIYFQPNLILAEIE